MRHTFSILVTFAKSSRLVLNHAQAHSSLLQTLLIISWRQGFTRIALLKA